MQRRLFRMSWRVNTFTILCTLWIGAPPPLRAMTAVDRPFAELVSHAEQIVIGTVSTIEEAPDTRGAPWTLVTFTDLSVLKGAIPSTLTLRFYGGSAGGVTQQISDM